MSPGDGDGSKEAISVPVEIFGQSYTLRTEEDAAYVRSLAEFVNQRMREVADRTRTADTTKIAVLAALNIADDLQRLRRDSEAGSRDLESRAAQLGDLLDRALQSRP